MESLAPQQNEEAQQGPKKVGGGRTPFLRTRLDAEGFRVFTDDPTGVPIRWDAASGFLIVSDDAAKPLATAARVDGPAILAYRLA